MDRIWIYQADRTLNDIEVSDLDKRLTEFSARWTSHGKKLKASFEIRHNRFIVLKVENGFDHASGCSIDESVRFLREIEKEFNISLFDRSQVAYRAENEIRSCALHQLQTLYENRIVGDDTLVFDNTVTSGEEYASEWQKPLKESGYYGFVK